jgi:DNA-binding transcriptional regulator YiaG
MAQFSSPQNSRQPVPQREGVDSSELSACEPKLLHLLQTAKSLVFTTYVEATQRYLEQKSPILRQTSIQLTNAALKCYGERLAAQMSHDAESVSINFSGHQISFGPEPNTVLFQHQSDYDQVVQSIQSWLVQVFEQNALWNPISEEVWASVLVWTVQDLDLSTGQSTLESLAEEPFRLALWQECFDPEASELRSVYACIEAYWTAQISDQILQAIELEDLSSMTLEHFLGLTTSEQDFAIAIPQLSPFQAIAHLPWLSLLDSADRNIVDHDSTIDHSPANLQAQNLGQAVPAPRPLVEPEPLELEQHPLYLEHYLTRPQDLAVLPWELLTQLKQKFGLAVLQLQFLWMAHAMMQPHPQNTFTLKINDMREQLDWQLSSETDPPDPLALVIQLRDLKISSIWMTDPRSSKVEAFSLNGSPWEVLSDVRGNLDWTTGQLTHPEQVYVTIRSGLWVSRLLELGGLPVKTAFQTVGRLALVLLRQGYCKEPLVLSLLIYLMFREALLNDPEQRPIDSVRELLTAALPYPSEAAWTIQPESALTLLQVWHRALEALLVLNWRPSEGNLPYQWSDFYGPSCPDWLLHASPKPKDWVEQWLALPILLKPPLADKLGTSTPQIPSQISSEGSKHLVRLRFDRLTGSEVRSARKAMRLTQSQLADALHVHQSLIAKIEAGRRSVSDDLEQSLRKVLAL